MVMRDARAVAIARYSGAVWAVHLMRLQSCNNMRSWASLPRYRIHFIIASPKKSKAHPDGDGIQSEHAV